MRAREGGLEIEAPGRRRAPVGPVTVVLRVHPHPSSAKREECGGDLCPDHLPDIANSPDFLSPGPDTPESSELLDCVQVVWALHVVVALGRAEVLRVRGQCAVKVADL